MVIIDKAFSGISDLHQYLQRQSGFKEALKAEQEAWKYDTPLWTSPSNFIGCDLIYRGDEVGPITEVHIHTTKRGQKAISFNTANGNYKFSYSHVRFFNRLYGQEQVISLHPTRGGQYMWSRGFVLNEKDYKSLYYQTEEYQSKYGKTMVERYGVTKPYQSEAIKAKATQTMQERYGVDWFLSRGPHYSSVTSTMIDRYGVDNFFNRGEHYSAVTQTMIERYGVENIFMAADFKEICSGISKREREVLDFLAEKLGYEHRNIGNQRSGLQHGVQDKEENKTYYVDFMIEEKNVIVEFNGDYWHCNPHLYEANYFHELKKKTAQEIWDYDAHRKQRIEQITGYRVITVWEYEWAKRKEKTKKWLLNQILA